MNSSRYFFAIVVVFCVLEQLFEIMKPVIKVSLNALLLNIFYYRFFIVRKRNVYVMFLGTE